MSILRLTLLTLLLAAYNAVRAAPSDIEGDPKACRAEGWEMTREIKAFAGESNRVTAGSATWNTPVLWADTLYAVTLRPQSEVSFVQESPNAPRAAASMGGLGRFTVLRTGRYRVTVNTALWIDAVDATGIVAPSRYMTWHECSAFRKSVEFKLQAGQSVVVQLSGANVSLSKVTIEQVDE